MVFGHWWLFLLYIYFQGVTLDERGHFTGEAEKKLEEVILKWCF